MDRKDGRKIKKQIWTANPDCPSGQQIWTTILEGK